MRLRRLLFALGIILLATVVTMLVFRPNLPEVLNPLLPSKRNIAEIRTRITPGLTAELTAAGFELGAPVYLRIFKEDRQLEAWIEKNGTFELFQTFDICNYSGALGPKLKEGDRQSPEGFYHVAKSALNPNSSFHLSFNLGFPNAFDRAQARTGSFLMVHGKCSSIGCYAMTDPGIERIYVLAEAALNAGQPFFRVHAFPFRMTDKRLAQEANNPWFGFWQNLKQGYDFFETTGSPPDVTVTGGKYAFAEG
jgi:murein L,D-transpeptidase YafK